MAKPCPRSLLLTARPGSIPSPLPPKAATKSAIPKPRSNWSNRLAHLRGLRQFRGHGQAAAEGQICRQRRGQLEQREIFLNPFDNRDRHHGPVHAKERISPCLTRLAESEQVFAGLQGNPEAVAGGRSICRSISALPASPR